MCPDFYSRFSRSTRRFLHALSSTGNQHSTPALLLIFNISFFIPLRSVIVFLPSMTRVRHSNQIFVIDSVIRKVPGEGTNYSLDNLFNILLYWFRLDRNFELVLSGSDGRWLRNSFRCDCTCEREMGDVFFRIISDKQRPSFGMCYIRDSKLILS